MRQHSAPWLVAALAALAVTAGCAREEPAPAADTRQEGAAEGVASDLNDGWITTKIQAKFFADRDVKARDIDVSTNDGVVTLTGRVDSDAVRQQAIAIARDTDGVVRVEDRLSSDVAATTGMTPAQRTDPDRPATTPPAAAPGAAPDYSGERTAQEAGDFASAAWITTKIQAKYFADSVVKGRRIDVTTNNGVVTLTGQVENNSERQQALQLARETEGVRRVEDRLHIVSGDAAAQPGDTGDRAAGGQGDGGFTEQMSDAGITARVQSKFFLDDTVKARNINVDTSGGVVTLQGEVQSELEREQAVALARSVDGVTDVQSQLEVNRAAETSTTGRATEMARDAGTAVDDTWITTKIQSKYFVDDLVKGGRIDVTTENGVVTLAGQVESQAAKQRAEALAKQTSGVSRVENRLTVGTESTSTSLTTPPEPVPAR